ncbi:MAG: DUF4198 domain-containing protein [Deltaproteobacteria bacterium]|nr:DUF4198 domain-containing protein [Deltaproteobacteria bacterium]
MKFIHLLLFGLLLAGCTEGSAGIEGQLSFNQHPLAEARIEFYLKNGTERSATPFSVATSDAQGNFQALLPRGNYYLVARKKEQGGGLNRMLMAEYAANPVKVDRAFIRIQPLALKEVGAAGSIVADGKTSVRGQLQVDGQPVAGAFIYVYTRGNALTGPSYGQVTQSDEHGFFRLNLSAGQYWLSARRRSDGSRVGDVSAGDLSGEYPGNPLTLQTGQQLTLTDWPLRVVNETLREQKLEQGKFTRTRTWLSGRVVDEDQAPVSDIYLFAYRDSRMIGKPDFISMPSAKDGQFVLYLDQGGEYYLGARSTFGGPLEPGERVGTYDQRPDHGVLVKKDQQTSLGDIVVREVW